jgi:hypothetical protein
MFERDVDNAAEHRQPALERLPRIFAASTVPTGA